MTDFDLDRLGDVWRQQPDPAELERLRRSAAMVSRRARRAWIVDVVAAFVVAAVVILLVLSNPKVGTFVIGSATLLILLGSNIRIRKLRQVELRSLTGSTEDMLDQSIERLETMIKHNRLSLIFAGPALLAGLLSATVADPQVVNNLVPALRQLPRVLLNVIGFCCVVTACLVVAFRTRRGQRELERLRAMREAYRHEHDSTTG
jgi:hypothetical protein